MIFIGFLKAREEKNKYGMLPLNFNRRTNVAMEHNGKSIAVSGGNLVQMFNRITENEYRTKPK
jgi:hypothetical protein